MKINTVVNLIKDSLRLIQAINTQGKDNPKMTKTIFGEAIFKESQRINKQLEIIQTTVSNDKN